MDNVMRWSPILDQCKSQPVNLEKLIIEILDKSAYQHIDPT